MRTPLPASIEPCRLRNGINASEPGETFGAFVFANGLRVIVCKESRGWEHVSVSRADRCPTWDEMSYVKKLFWTDDECVVQFHPPKSEYVNHHPFVLHLWRDTRRGHRLPPKEFV